MSKNVRIKLLLVISLFGLIACASTVQAAEAKKEAPKPAAKPAVMPRANHAAMPGAKIREHHEVAKGHEAERGHEVGGGHEAGRGHEAMRAHHEFRGRDVHHFNHAELARWRGGRWRNTCFDGRCGNWWFADGQWYFYDHPVYPYPLEVAEVTFLEPVVVAPVAQVVVQAAAPMQVAPSAAAQVWYYCDNPPGYYPYVKQCNTQYREVAAKPR